MYFTRVVIFISAFFTFMLTFQVAYACSCVYAGKFIDYTSNSGVIRATIKQLGPKLSHGNTLYESMTVEVNEVVKGEYDKRDIIFLGDPGHLCRAYVNSERFKIGSEHLIAISSKKEIQPLGGCGESAVAINDGKISGRELIGNQYKRYSFDLHEYLEMLKTN